MRWASPHRAGWHALSYRLVNLHELWHVLVLVSALFGAAGAGILGLAPLVFDETPPGLVRARPFVGAAVLGAALLLGAEWLGVH